jgi:hypothetical protein
LISGEVHRYTLTPAFPSMLQEFRCHIAYKPPQYLYNITYTVSIPSLKYHVGSDKN